MRGLRAGGVAAPRVEAGVAMRGAAFASVLVSTPPASVSRPRNAAGSQSVKNWAGTRKSAPSAVTGWASCATPPRAVKKGESVQNRSVSPSSTTRNPSGIGATSAPSARNASIEYAAGVPIGANSAVTPPAATRIEDCPAAAAGSMRSASANAARLIPLPSSRVRRRARPPCA